MRILQKIGNRLHLPGRSQLQSLAAGPIIPRLSHYIRSFPAEAIGVSSLPLLHVFAALKSDRPIVLHGGLHPEDEAFRGHRVLEAIARCDRYIANTQYEANWIVERGIRSEGIFTIGVGVDLEPFAGITTAVAKQSLGFGEEPVIGFIGQISGHKGVDTLVKAMPRIWETIPNARLLVAGAKTSFARELERAIASLSRRQQVTAIYNFPNEDKPRLFRAIDILAYPSGYESFGIAFLEAWAAGKPVISCRRGAIPWVVESGVDGLLVEFGDAEMLAVAAIDLLGNPQLAWRMGERGRQKVVQRYAWTQIARAFREVYRGILPCGSKVRSGAIG